MENFRLKVFRIVAHHLNFRRAADELSLTQPAVTQQIKALEDEYGVPLFDRGGGRIVLTAAGRTLLPFAEQIKQISNQAFEAVAKVSGTQAGRLAIGASQTIGQYLLPNFIAEFLRQYPRVGITAVSGNTDDIVESLSQKRIQLALVEGPMLRKDIKSEPFMEDHMVLVVPGGHEWAEHEIEVSDLKSAALLTREFGSGSRRVVELALGKAGISKKELRATMELDSTEGLLSAVEAGLGVTFVSRWAVRNQIALGTLRIVKIRGLKISRMFSIAYASGPVPAGNAGAFRRFILARSQNVLIPAVASTGKAKPPNGKDRSGGLAADRTGTAAQSRGAHDPKPAVRALNSAEGSSKSTPLSPAQESCGPGNTRG
ncbi:MAG TPA: LysR substrate-binding domain-containing protein [Acidobacteriaceae bacterium]|nr:LysR substrate-binding domain-containing protein [Acidobacteriaceae bacterium]